MEKHNKTFHFISGLPRAGSTLLVAILRQNPRFYARITSPVSHIVSQAFNAMFKEPEFSLFLTEEQKRAILQGIVTNYYQHLDGEVMFDMNRSWCARLNLINALFPTAKIIVCVRNLAWVMDSFERLVRGNALNRSTLFTHLSEAATVYTRISALAQPGHVVGFAYDALKEAYYSEQASSMLLVDYEQLTQFPEPVMQSIYQFIGEEYFAHNFDHLEYEEAEYDRMLKTPGLHKIRTKVCYCSRSTILPPDLFEQYSRLSFWQQDFPTKAQRITAIPA